MAKKQAMDDEGRWLFTCSKCGHIDHRHIEDGGFWEKGCNEAGEEIYECAACGEWVPILPLPIPCKPVRP